MSRDWKEKFRDVLQDKNGQEDDMTVSPGDIVVIDDSPFIVAFPCLNQCALIDLETGNRWGEGINREHMQDGSLRELIGKHYDKYRVEVYS